ncbi:putative flagellar protein FliS [Trichinella nativa]|uniref:Putative flagellar protein FliS n=1 Tax=Trichinella nativa TaxID=6335 RepID=A0A1Y3EQE7_9BILA|nr:putative flagellar protein FliS [Trichinella nativa]
MSFVQEELLHSTSETQAEATSLDVSMSSVASLSPCQQRSPSHVISSLMSDRMFDKSIGPNRGAVVELSGNPPEIINQCIDYDRKVYDPWWKNFTFTSAPNVQEIELLIRRNHPSELIDEFLSLSTGYNMGVMEEIGYAWASVNSNLYVWNYENNSELSFFDGLVETICTVACAKVKSGVRLAGKPSYLLCIVTTSNVFLHGLSFSESRVPGVLHQWNGTYTQLHMQPRPLFTVGLQKMIVTHVYCTHNGRIFLGTTAGYICENRPYFGKSCWLKNHSLNFITSFMPQLLLAVMGSDEVKQIVCDESRNILYTLHQSGAIELYDLGVEGDCMNQVAYVSYRDIEHAAEKILHKIMSIELTPVISICPIYSCESKFLNLIAITSKGVRLYFTCQANVGLPNYEQQVDILTRPCALTLVHVRLPPGYDVTDDVQQPKSIIHAHCNAGMSLFIERANDDSDVIWCLSGKLFCTYPKISETFTKISLWGQTVFIKQIPPCKWMPTDAEIRPLQPCMKRHLNPPREPAVHRQLSERFLIMTNNCIQIYESRSRSTIVLQILNHFGPASFAAENIYRIQRPVEICCVALNLLCRDEHPDAKMMALAVKLIIFHRGAPTWDVQEQTFLMRHSTPLRPLYHRPETAGSGDLTITSSCFHVASRGYVDIRFSFRHNAFYLYFSRIIGFYWNSPLATVRNCADSSGKIRSVIQSLISPKEITDYLKQLQNFSRVLLDAAMRVLIDEDQEELEMTTVTWNFSAGLFGTPEGDLGLREGTSSLVISLLLLFVFFEYLLYSISFIFLAKQMEQQSLLKLHSLVTLTQEVLHLWRTLLDHQVHVIAASLTEEVQNRLVSTTLRDLLTPDKLIFSAIINALISVYLDDQATASMLTADLRTKCPTLFTRDDAAAARAAELMELAQVAENELKRRELLQNALDLYLTIGDQVDLDTACKIFQQCKFYKGIVQLACSVAKCIDKTDSAFYHRHLYFMKSQSDNDNIQMPEILTKRLLCYDYVIRAIASLRDEVDKSVATANESFATSQRSLWDQVLSMCWNCDDCILHYVLLDWLFQYDFQDDMLKSGSPHFEDYLQMKLQQKEKDNEDYVNLLWRFLEHQKKFLQAAKLLQKLAAEFSYVFKKYDIDRRIEFTIRAVLCIKAGKENRSFEQYLEDQLDILKMQKSMLALLRKENLTERTIQLYDLAEEFDLPECKLAIMQCCSQYDAQIVDQLWREIISKEFRTCMAEGLEELPSLMTAKLVFVSHHFVNSPRYFPAGFVVSMLLKLAFQGGFADNWLARTVQQMSIPIGTVMTRIDAIYRVMIEYGNQDNALKMFLIGNMYHCALCLWEKEQQMDDIGTTKR